MSVQAATVERADAVGRGHSLALTGTWLLSAAMATAGVLAYAFQILAAQTLTTSEYGQIGALWAALFIAVVVLFRPLEQTTSRAVADRLSRGDEAASVLRSVAAVYCCLLVLLAIAAALAWTPLTRALFDGTDFLTLMLVLGVAGYGVQYVARGILGGLRRFHALGGIHIGDGSIRLLAALPLLAVASKDVAAVALAVAGIGGALVPLWRSRREIAALREGSPAQPFHMRAAVGFAVPAAVIAGSDQLLVNGAPLLVLGSSGGDKTKEAAIVFAATMLVRIPVFLFSGVAGSLLPNFTRLQAERDHGHVTRAVARVCVLFVGVTAVFVVAAAVAGPAAMKLLYGPDYVASSSDLALLGLGAGAYLFAATISQALLARALGGRAALAWAASALLFVGVYLLAAGSELHRVSLAVAIGMVANTLLLALTLLLSRRADV
jgi:O-antigen/teichoic acid export membrane protein